MTASVLLWAGPDDPPDGSGYVLCWSSYSQSEWVFSIPGYLEEHAERFRAKYLAFVHDLGETRVVGKRVVDHWDVGDGFSFWWMSQLAEKSPFKSPRIYDCLRLLVLEEILLEKKPIKILAHGFDCDLTQAIDSLCRGLRIQFTQHSGPQKQKWSLRNFYLALPYAIQGFISLRHLVANWPLRRLASFHWFSGGNSIFLCSYFFNLDSKACAEGRFYSRQWELLPQIFQSSGWHANWIHHFLRTPSSPDILTGIDWVGQFNRDASKQGCHAFLETYLSFRVVFLALKNWIKLNFCSWRLRTISRAFHPKESTVWLWPLLKSDWKTSLSGPVALQNCLWKQLFDAALKDMPHQNIGIYLWENQGWEIALIHAWRRHGHGQIIGVPHATTAFWHLNNFDDPRSLAANQNNAKQSPDYLALNGPMAWKAFSESGYPIDRLAKVEASRFHHLITFCSKQPATPGPYLPSTQFLSQRCVKKILILGDFTSKQTIKMLLCAEAAIRLIGFEIALTLKPHPACKICEQDFPNLAFDITASPLTEILNEYDLAFCSNTTSAALDAFLAGLPLAIFLDGEDFNHSPLRGVQGIKFVGTAEELASAFESIRSTVDLPAATDFFWLDANFSRWRHLLAPYLTKF